MFGLGWMEIALLVAVVVMLFGVGPSGRLLGRLFGTYRKVSGVKDQVRSSLNPLNYLRPDDRDDPPA